MNLQIKNKNHHALVQRFGRFATVGMISAVGHYGLLIALVQIFEVNPVVGSIPAAILGAFINYYFNYRYTFNSRKQHRESAPRFTAVAISGVLLNTFLMWVGVSVLNAYYLVAQVASTVLVLVWSFSLNQWWTFRSA
jgi:putative flippase GtrA